LLAIFSSIILASTTVYTIQNTYCHFVEMRNIVSSMAVAVPGDLKIPGFLPFWDGLWQDRRGHTLVPKEDSNLRVGPIPDT